MSEPEYMDASEELSPEIVQVQPTALAIINQSEHAAMVQTANLQGNKRRIEEFSKKLLAYATHSQPVALSMFYTLPRAGKQIVGPGVRFAEVVAPCWKNNSTGSRIVGSTDETVTAQGVFIDYESNMRNVKEIPRRITDKDNRKFNSDMILTTSKAALSIAYREAILKGGVPMALWNPAYEQAKLTAVGTAVSHAARIDAAMDYLTKLGVTEWQIMNSVGLSSPKEMEIDHLVTLKTLCEEIKKGARTIEDVFGSPFDKEIESLFTQLKKNETEKRLLRDSYMGRAKELLEYLRGRVGAGTTTGQPIATAKTEEKVKEPATQAPAAAATEQKASTETAHTQASGTSQTQQGEPVRRGRGRPSREEVAAREAAAKKAEAPQQEQASAPVEAAKAPEPEPEPQVEADKQPEPEAAQDVMGTLNLKF